MPSVGIIGASGFAGAELLRILASHPDFDVVYATGDSAAGELVADLYPALAAADPRAPVRPNGPAQRLVPDLLPKVGHILDLSADFRLKDPALYPAFYGGQHQAPELLA